MYLLNASLPITSNVEGRLILFKDVDPLQGFTAIEYTSQGSLRSSRFATLCKEMEVVAICKLAKVAVFTKGGAPRQNAA